MTTTSATRGPDMTVRERTAAGKIPPVYGQRLRRARRAKGWSVRELTVKSGLAYSTIIRAGP